MADLVIGGRGFIGSHLVKRLNNPLVVDLRNGQDASKHGVLESLKIKPKVIYMLAANLNPDNDDDVHLYRNVSEYAKDVKAHVVYTSSAATYNPDTLYAVQKLYGEVLFKGSTLRLFNVYGDGGSGIVDTIKFEDDIEIHGNGEQRRNYVHVSDVVEALLVAGKMRWLGTSDIATDRTYSVNELMEMAEKDGEYVDKHPGVMDSIASLPTLPWKAKHELEGYYEEA